MYGCGKSTFARELLFHAMSHNLKATVCSSDDYFTDTFGNYQFDPNSLVDANRKCAKKFVDAFESHHSVIVLDNPNLEWDDFAEYYDFARRLTHFLYVVEFSCPDESRALKLNERSIHCVPAETAKSSWEIFNNNRLAESNPYLQTIDPRGI